jgi:hypothetical protein
MQNDIYEVLDIVTEGLRLQAEFQPRANYSLTTSGIPFLRAIAVHNETGATLESLDVTATLTLFDRTAVFRTSIPGPLTPNSVTRIDDVQAFAVFAPLLARTSESTPGTLDVVADAPTGTGSTLQTRILAPVEISAANEWLNFPGLHAALASFVQPNTHTITAIIRSASELMLKRTGSGSLDGYQGGPQRAHRLAGALYESIRALEVTYTAPPASFERTGQKVRTTETVLRDRFGTCIDLAVLYAACLEAVGLFPVIFITSDHAFTGFHVAETYGATSTVTDVNVLTNLVEAGLVHPVELTGIGPGKYSLPFTDASRLAADYFRNSFSKLQTMVDVTRARLDGVRPMPQQASDDEMSDEQLAEERPFVARSSLRNLDLAAEAETVRGVMDRTDDSPARFKNWKRDLLDLTLRNPLLNLPHNQKVLDILVPGGMLPLLDDTVHSGKKVKISGGIDSSELQKLAGIRVASEIAPEAMIDQLRTQRTVYSTLDEDKHRKQLRAIKREADTLEQESGSNYLYLSLGTLIHTKADGSEARAPLFLLPVRLTGGRTFSPYSMSLDGEEVAQPNLCLLQWLKTTRGVDLTALSSPALDDSGLAIGATLAAIRRQLIEAELPYRIDESASLAILRFSTFQIWKDLDSNWRPLMENPVVRHLVETPGETFVDPAGSGELMVDETSLRLPIAADGSQMAAIVRATSGQSFVLEGPPGTGKSQTITNLIAHALTAGKKVLFVAEKQAALEVVKRRLDAIGLGTFGLELHGAKQSMNAIREQLRAALSLRVESDARTWEATDARLRAAIVELTRYPELVHDENPHGYSLWSAHNTLGTLGEGPTAVIPAGWVTAPSPDDVSALTRDFSDAAIRLGLRGGYRWLISGQVDAAGLQLDALTAALTGLSAARAQVSQLGEPARAALGQAVPGGDLAVLADLIDARNVAPLPTGAERVAIDSPAWRSEADAVRAAVTQFGTAHAGILARSTAAGFTLAGLDGLIAQSEKLDGSWFFPELRRGALRSALAGVLQGGSTPDGAEVTGLLRSLKAAADDSATLAARISALAGVAVPEGWHAYNADAADAFALAESRARAAVALARTAPQAWAYLLTPSPSAAEDTALQQISAAWAAWLTALAATPTTVRQWAQDSWMDSWHRDETLWAGDLASSGVLQPQRFAETRRLLTALSRAGLDGFADQLATADITPALAVEALQRGLAAASLDERSAAGSLDLFDGDGHDRTTDSYLAQSAALREQLRTAVAARLISLRPFDADNLRGEVAELARQIERKRGGLAFRELARRYPRALTSIAPCFLMSPGSVAHFLDADSIEFDLVVFDEASQIRVPQAIGAMGRAKAVVVVGDSKQMPPTRIMQVDAVSETDPTSEELVVEDLESILTEAVESGLPQLWLNWHYRSQDESLIAFSNATYYDDKLVSLPSPLTADNTGLSWRRVDGVFDRGRGRTNEVEATAIVDEIRARLAAPATADDSIGVVCFNIQQRDLILNKLEDSPDLLIQRALAAEPGASLFVKNLENVQGDERDTILFSLAFSLDPNTGRLPLNFGPLSLSGGERRLNVAVTRARREVVLFSSFAPSDIDLSRTAAKGIADLRHYLEFAATRTLPPRTRQGAQLSNRGRLVEELSAALTAEGLEVQAELGMSSFRVDLAVREPGDTRWRMAVMVDGPGWASRPTVSDRDGSPNLLVHLMGWPAVSRIWLPEWLRDRQGVLDGLLDTLRSTDMALPTPVTSEPVTPEPVTPEPVAAGPVATDPVFPDPVLPEVVAPGLPDPGLDGAAPGVPSMRTAAQVDVAPPAAAAPTVGLPPFVPAEDSVIASQSLLNNIRMAEPAVLRIAGEVLAAEGPIPLDRLMSTVARRFGLSRLGEAKRTDVTSVLTGHFRIVGRFVWPQDLDPATWRGARRSPSTAVRPVADVSPHEIVNAAELVLRQSFSMISDDLVRETADILGYGRLSEQGRTWVAAAVDAAVAERRLIRDGERLMLP